MRCLSLDVGLSELVPRDARVGAVPRSKGTKVHDGEEIKRFTSDRGVAVVYDSVGAIAFDASLRCLKPRGTLLLYEPGRWLIRA